VGWDNANCKSIQGMSRPTSTTCYIGCIMQCTHLWLLLFCAGYALTYLLTLPILEYSTR